MSRPQPRLAFEAANSANHLALAPGGYLDSQTTDTQFFSTLNAADFPPSLDAWGSSQSPEPETIPPATKGVPQSPPIPSTVLPKASKPEPRSDAPTTEDVPQRPSIPSFPKAPPESEERRTLGPMMKWDRLDDFVNGPEYSNGRLWTTFPLLKQFRPDNDHPSRALKWTWIDASPKEVELLTKFELQLLRLSSPRMPSNCIQGESMYILMFLARLIPFMGRAVMDSDLERTQALIKIVRDLMKSLDTLRDVEEEARERLNVMLDEEMKGL